MMRIIGNERERGLQWLMPRLELGHGHWDTASCLFLEKDGAIVACVAYNHWYPETSVEISVAADKPNWLNRAFLREVFRFPFEVWNMRRVGSTIAASNEKSIRFCEHLGFVREGCVRQGAPNGEDLYIYGMLKDECRYLRMN